VRPEDAELHLAAAERRRLAEVFGDVLPESPPDDDEGTAADRHDAELVRDVPPHHAG